MLKRVAMTIVAACLAVPAADLFAQTPAGGQTPTQQPGTTANPTGR